MKSWRDSCWLLGVKRMELVDDHAKTYDIIGNKSHKTKLLDTIFKQTLGIDWKASVNDLMTRLQMERGPLIDSIVSEFEQYFEEALFFFPFIESHVRRLEPKKVAEIGSGIGLLAMLISLEVDEIYGYEPSSAGFQEVNQANRTISDSSTHNAIFVEDFFSRNRGMFDLIYSVNVLEHTSEWRKIVKDAIESLNFGGQLVLIFPNYTFPYEPHYNIPIIGGKKLTKRLFRNQIENSQINDPEGHWADLSFPKYTELKKVLKDRSDLDVEFSKELMFGYLTRLGKDVQFEARKKGAFLVLAKVLKRLKIMRLIIRILPTRLQPVLYVTIKKKAK